MGSKTSKLSGTGQYVGPDTSNALYQSLQTGGKYDPAQWMNQGLQSYMQGIGAVSDLYGQGISAQIPGLQDVARSTAENALSQYGVDARALAQQQARQAQENVASEYAGSGALNSGAALKAIAQGTANPLLQAETNIANQYGNLYGQTANALYGNAYQNLANQGSALTSLYGNLGAQQYGYGGQLTGLLGQLGQSSYIAPQYVQKQGLGSQILGAATGGLIGGITGGLGKGIGTALGGGISGLFGGGGGGNILSSSFGSDALTPVEQARMKYLYGY